jgi:hypothetical protein
MWAPRRASRQPGQFCAEPFVDVFPYGWEI